MTALQAIFYFFSFLAIGSGFMVVISRNSVHAALFLVLAFVSMAGVWILLHAEFLALILVLVYVGAVMTLFLFVVMMLSVNAAIKKETFVRYLPFGGFIIIMMIGLIVLMVLPGDRVLIPTEKPADYSNIAELGSVLYTQYVYAFEVAAVLLLTAIVAAICLTHRPPLRRKIQNPAEQINVQPHDRLKIIKFKRSLS